jgi:hypothetical protein
MVKENDMTKTIDALSAQGHQVMTEDRGQKTEN